MESVGSTHKKQRAKDDIISKLPDSLITRILSCLPTKDAVRTSVLSKRWIECWTFITKVMLDDSAVLYNYSLKRKKSSEKQQQFINFVYKTLLLIQSYSMESMSLVITTKYDATVVNAWISCILNRRPKKVRIRTNFELPFSILTSHFLFNDTSSLEELELEMCCCAIKVCSCSEIFIFRNLKVLKLCGIVFTFGHCIILFSVLKKFETKNCSWLSARDVTVELKVPLLECVYIEQDHESVTREPHRCTIKFSAPCMKEFTYCGDGISQAITLSDPSSARNASANIILRRRGSNVQETQSRVSLLLKQFSQVKCIRFQGSEVLTQPNVAVLRNFAMLSHLDLGSVGGEVLLGLLQKSPVLSTLVFQGISKFDQELLNSTVVPDCLATTLKVVKFGNVYGSEHELFLAKYFMENGTVLERMSFSLKKRLSQSELIEEFKEKLYSFKRGVSFAILEFHY